MRYDSSIRRIFTGPRGPEASASAYMNAGFTPFATRLRLPNSKLLLHTKRYTIIYSCPALAMRLFTMQQTRHDNDDNINQNYNYHPPDAGGEKTEAMKLNPDRKQPEKNPRPDAGPTRTQRPDLPRVEPKGFFGNLDGRLLLIVALVSGVLIWRLPDLWITPFTAFWVILAFVSGARKKTRPSILRGYALFFLFWVGLKIILDTIGLLWQKSPLLPETYAPVLIGAGVLGLRLIAMGAVGVFVVGVAGSRKLSIAFAWMLKPFMRKNAWKAALAMTLMLRFIPLTRRILRYSKTAVRLRCESMGVWERMGMVIGVALSLLAKQTWTQTIAVASRGLDCPEAWEEVKGKKIRNDKRKKDKDKEKEAKKE